MKKRLNKINTINKISLSAILIMLISNPWSVGYIDYAIELFATYFVMYSIYFFIASLVTIIGVVIYFMWNTREQVNIPKVKSTREK